MNTGADGQHARTNMFLWQSLAAAFYAPCVDGDYDFGVFGHEFGHMIENRMIAKGVGARQGNAAGAMGEAFGDFDALEVMNALHIAPVPGSDRYTEGAYVTGNPYNGIRDFLAGRPMGGQFPQPGRNPDTDPLNYGDFGFDLDGARGARRRRDLGRGADGPAGSLPAAVPVERRGSRHRVRPWPTGRLGLPGRPALDPGLLRRDGADAAAPDDDRRPRRDARGRPGALRRGQPGPALAGLRDARLRPLQSTLDANDTDPVPDFSSPLANNATLNFSADSKSTEVPVSAKIYVGDYQARSTQIADTDPGTTGAVNLDNTAPFVPNGAGSLTGDNPRWTYYNFTAVAPGYGIVRFRVRSLQAGETRNITIHFAPNFASATNGATVTGDTLGTNTNLVNVTDDDEGTIDGQTGAPVAGRWIVIRLGGVGPNGSNVKRLGVSAQLVPNTNRFTALRSFTAYVCRAGKTPGNQTCDGSVATGWTPLVSAPADAFPSVNPRPAAPDLTLRYFDADHPGLATHLKLVVDEQPVHRPGVVPGRPGPGSEQQRGLQLEHPRERGARRRGRGLRPDRDGRRHAQRHGVASTNSSF